MPDILLCLHRRGTRIAYSLFLITLLSGCCVRWCDSSRHGEFTPRVEGDVHFVLSLYKDSTYDAANQSTGETRRTIKQDELSPVPRDFTRSFVLAAAPGTRIVITTSNQRSASGEVGDEGELRVPRLFTARADSGVYQTEGSLGCLIDDLVIIAAPEHPE